MAERFGSEHAGKWGHPELADPARPEKIQDTHHLYRYYGVIGSAEALMLKAADLGQQHRQWSSCGLRDTRKKQVRSAVMRG
ncbi:MAG: hypothetical protein U5L08_15690 [Xanthomonadales bacterium]|nr:hypothetical protein [Xanthomonadales bacterium]